MYGNIQTKRRLIMNNVKRKELAKISDRLSAVKDVLNDIKSDLEYALSDE